MNSVSERAEALLKNDYFSGWFDEADGFKQVHAGLYEHGVGREHNASAEEKKYAVGAAAVELRMSEKPRETCCNGSFGVLGFKFKTSNTFHVVTRRATPHQHHASREHAR